MRLPETLFDFAYCHASHFDTLAGLAAAEDWGPENAALKNYFNHFYRRIAQVHNALPDGEPDPHLTVIEHPEADNPENARRCCFDTGLYTDRYENIYALFVANIREDAQQAWFLKGFFKTSDPTLRDLVDLPQRVRFFDDPADLVYDYRYPIRVNIDHILGDEANLARVPQELRDPDKSLLLHRVFEGAVAEAERRVAANYMLAVPQYYNGRIQLLLPLCLMGTEPDLALAIQREDGYYSARTCLTIEMAYRNARLVSRPEAAWILQRER